MAMRGDLPAIHPYLERDIPWLLCEQAEQFGDKPFLTWTPAEGEETVWSYRDVLDRARRTATGLAKRGVGIGDRVIIHLSNRPEFFAAYFACSWLGAVAVTTNTYSARGELKYFAEHAGSKVAITETSLAPDLIGSGARWDWVACLDGAPEGAFPFEELMDADPAPQRPADPNLFHSIMYTSGTTSRPKAVVFTHANMLWAGECSANHFHISANDVALVYLPLFHLNALGYSSMSSLWAGSSIILMPRFSASRWWEVVTRHECTWTPVAGFVVQALKHLPWPNNHKFRFFGNGQGRDDIVDSIWGIPCIGMYGMTETVAQPIISQPGKRLTNGAIGRAAPEYALRIVDDDGRDVSSGETGRLLIKGVRGVSLFYEYLNNQEATEAAFDAGGWFDSGDMIRLLPDGSLQFADRKKDMLRVGGENVAASEVETVILGVPGVSEVAVVGQPHDFLHEVPVAFVVAERTNTSLTGDIEAACEAELARFKRPREIRYLAELPRIGIGKLDRNALRDLAKTPPTLS